jgi:hypothetical protein
VETLLAILAFLKGPGYIEDKYVDPCTKDASVLKVDKRLEFGILCSKVRSHRVGRDEQILALFGEDSE